MRSFGKKVLRWFILFAAGIFLFILVNQYLFCPQYSFPTPHPFSGPSIYNPYQDIDSTHWLKCNFHAHTRAWKGLTTGQGTSKKLWDTYESLGYDIHCISNYERVNHFADTSGKYLSAYEHGYGWKKNHQLLLNTHHVIWGDYYFPQTLSNKQQVLNCLAVNDTQLLSINHPLLSHGFAPDDMRYLSGYDCMEVLRGDNTYSFLNWDAALESGKPVFIIGDDDEHDIDNPLEVGRNCTWVNAPGTKAIDIIHALKTGSSYGMIIGTPAKETWEQKRAKVKAGLPMLRYVKLSGDTLRVAVSRQASQINFFGEHLQQLGMRLNVSNGRYVIKKSDSYVRTQIIFDDGTQIVLNPVFRYDGHFPQQQIPGVNKPLTFFLRLTGVLILIVYLLVMIMMGRKRRQDKFQTPE